MRHNYKIAEKLLEQENPLWFNLVDVDTLNMSDGEYCVLGQVGQKYYLTIYDTVPMGIFLFHLMGTKY